MKSAIPRLVPLVALTLALISSAACSSDGTTPTTSAPTTPAATTPWAADGIISTGEYTSSQSFTSGVTTFNLHWKTDAQFIYVAMEAQVTGYIAVALDPDIIGGKTNTDMLFGYVAGSQAFLFDQWARTEAGESHPDDTALGGVNNITEFGGRETGGKTIIEFKRLLNTGDQYDHPFVTGANRIMWAVHNTSDDLQVHTAFGRGSITIS